VTVRTERVGAAFVVTIDRPERRNAVDGATATGLVDAVAAFEAAASSVLVLTGSGGTFCAGADLTALESLAPRLLAGEAPLGPTHALVSKPVIAAIEGWCVAGGLELALWADLRVCAADARFGCLERRWGVPLVDGGTWRLPRVVGFGRALDLILTGRVVEAPEALAIGLVTQIAAEPLAAALELAELIATHPQPTMLSDRQSVYDGYGMRQSDALTHELALGRSVLAVGVEGAARFAAGEGRGGARRRPRRR